jgi:hypothetical protein
VVTFIFLFARALGGFCALVLQRIPFREFSIQKRLDSLLVLLVRYGLVRNSVQNRSSFPFMVRFSCAKKSYAERKKPLSGGTCARVMIFQHNNATLWRN